MPDKVKILYDAVSKDYNVGSFEEFQSKLQDDTKRKAFYDGVGTEFDLGDFKTFSSKVKKKDDSQPDFQIGSQTSLPGSKPFLPQVPTKTPSVLLSDEQKQQREKQRIGERFQTTLLNVPTEFGKVAPTMRAAKQVRETLPQAPEFRRYGEIKPMQPVEITEGQRIGESLTKGEGFQEVVTDKLTGKKTALEKQIEAAENAFRAYQGDEIANQVQSYIPPEETLKIKQELGFGEKMSNAGSNFVNRLERFVPNTAIAVGQTLTTLLGEDLGSDAYRMITSGGNADSHRMEAFDKLAKLDSEYKYSKGLIQSVQDLDLGGVAAAVTDAVGSLVSTVVTSAPTAGLGLYSDMVGGGLYDYNSTKANRLGISVDELYETGQNEFFAPAIINGIAAKLEDIGLKGIKQGILSNIKSKAGQKAGLIFHNSNKEGFTEWTQSGLEAYSNSLAQGKNPIQAGEEAVRTMFSKKGAESYLMGSVAAGAAIGGGRILKGIVSSREKKKAADALQKIEQQQQELNNPAISEESRVFIFDNIKNNVKEVVDAVYADVDESDNLGENQKKEVFELNKTIQALEIVANDPAVSEETKASAQTRIDELKSKVDSIIATPEIKLAKPTFDTEEQIIAEGQQAEAEFKQTDDLVTYEQKMKELDDRANQLIETPTEITEVGKEEINPIDKGKGFDNPDFIAYDGMFSKEKASSQIQTDIIADEVQGAKGYHFFYKGKKSRIEMMSPDEYLKRVREGFKTEKDENILDSSKAKINKSIEKGDKIDMPSLNYSESGRFGQEGRNRAVVAKERGEKLIPVLIEEDASMEDRIAKAKEILSSVKTKENTTESLIQEAKNKFNLHRDAVEFMRRNIDKITPKPKQDAVQKQTTGQVPVLTEAPVGEKVAKGKPEAKPEVVTEEGSKKEVVIDKESIVKNSVKELERVKSINRESEDGATFNIDGTKYDGTGLVVPVTSLNTTINKINPQMLADFVEKNKGKIGDVDTVKFGIYKFPNSNQISIDLNIIVPEKFKDQAIEFGRLAGQESLFDLETYENVKTGSDGKSPVDFTDTQFKEISKALKDGRIPNVFAKESKDLASKIRSLKINLGEGTAQSNIAGLPIALYNSVVETVALLVEAGSTISEAIDKAVKKYNLDKIEKFNKSELSKNIQESSKPQKAKSVKDIDVNKIRTQNRPGKRISKGLNVKNVKGEKIVEESDNLSVEYVKENAPDVFINNANILTKYPIVAGIKKFGEIKNIEDAQQVYDIFIRQVADNLKNLTNDYNLEFRDIATLWYDGANILANKLSSEYNVTPEQAAGIIAAMSPQKDWYMNVRLAELVMLAYKQDAVLTNDMIAKQIEIIKIGEKPFLKNISDAKKALQKNRTKENVKKSIDAQEKYNKNKENADKVIELLKKYVGVNINSAPKAIQPYIIRLNSELNNPKEFNILRPDGEVVGVAKTIGGKNKKIAWGSYSEIGKAASIYNDGSQENITRSLGEMHKIRNFYNNIIDPMSKDGDVTIDTHAVAAALMQPLSGKSKQVGQNFGTGTSNSKTLGIKGLYYAYLDAYNLAARELGLLPRQVQSITWEAVRGLFTDTFKRDTSKVKKINDIWKNYEDGNITIEQTRRDVTESAGGIKDPTWAKSILPESEDGVEQGFIGGGVEVSGSDIIGEPSTVRVAAKTLRKLKIDLGKGTAQSNIAGLPIALYNAAIETIALGLEAGLSIRDAINKAIEKHKLLKVKEFDKKSFVSKIEAELDKKIAEDESELEGISDDQIKKQIGKSVDDLKQELKEAKGSSAKIKALNALKERLTPTQFNSFIDENPSYKRYEAKASQLEFSPDVVNDLVEIGSTYIQDGVNTFRDFADRLNKKYGKEIPESLLRDIYKRSAQKKGLGVRRTPERIATGEAISPELKEIADETESLYQKQEYKEIQDILDDMSEADKNTLVGTLANVTGQLSAEGNIGVLAAIDLINEYEASGDKAGAQRVFDTISKSATAFAQLLRQYGQLKSSTPQGYVSIVEKDMKKRYNVELTDDQKGKIEELYINSKKALDAEVAALDELADNLKDPNYDKAEGYKKWGASTVLLEDANRKLSDYIDSLKPATAQSLFQNLTSIVQGNLLTIKSLIINPVSNAAQAGIRIAGNEIANLFDFIINVTLKTGRTKISGFDPQAISLGSKAFARGLAKANRMLIKGAADTDLAKIDVAGRLKPVNAWKSLYRSLRGKQSIEFVKTIDDLAVGTLGIPSNLLLRLLPYGDLPRNEQVKIAKLIEIGRNKFNLKGAELEAFTLKPDPKSLAEAQLEGDKSTLQEPNAVYKKISELINSIDSKGDDRFTKGLLSGIKFIVRGTIVPFLKTPINYAFKTVRFTNPIIPYSQALYHMTKAIVAANSIKNPLLREAAIRRHQSKLTEYLGEAVIAQAIMSSALILIGNGLITGDAPEEEEESKERNFMFQSIGPNMINISGLKRLLSGEDPTYRPGDKAIAYNALGILGAQLGISSNTLTYKQKEDIRKKKFVTTEGKPFYEEDKGFYLTSIQDMSSNLPASLNFTLNQGFAQGAGTLLSAIEEKKYSEWSDQTVKTLVTGLAVPNTVYQSFKAGNDYYRNVYTEDQVEQWGNIISERLGNIEDLPIKYDMWGKPIKLTPEGSNPYVYHVLDIFKTQKVLQDKNTYYVFDLYKKTGDNSVIPTSVKDIMKEEGGVYPKLNPAQKSELQRIVGEERAKYVEGKKGGALSMKNYDPNNDSEEYWERQIKKLKSAYKLGLMSGKRRFEKEILKNKK